jgi:hypothetical protein
MRALICPSLSAEVFGGGTGVAGVQGFAKLDALRNFARWRGGLVQRA